MSEYGLLVGIAGFVVLNTGLLIAVLATKMFARRELRDTLAAFQAEADEREVQSDQHFEEQMGILRVVRELAESSRINRKESAAMGESVRDDLAQHPTREDLARKIEEVPARTAERLRQGDSGTNLGAG